MGISDQINAGITPRSKVTKTRTRDETNAVWNALGYTAWEFLNVTSLGTLGLLGEKTGLDPYAKSARIGRAIGSAAGFLGPMKVSGKVFGAPFRHLTKAGTRGLQREAAKGLQGKMKEKFGKTISDTDALKIVKEQTEDIVGFTGRGFKNWLMGGPAADKAIKQAKLILEHKLPDRLRGALKDAGHSITKRQARGLTRDVTEIVSRKPINNISSLVINKWGPKTGPFIAKVAGYSAQEAVEFALVGTVMDYVNSYRDEYPEFELFHWES